ncbi:NADPH-dependent FMN reductase [Gammaproteobacteria bacterium]|jgi:multimeric flavodoxin WrbA|nr:NADPH-dependent FMN reductase [Gammaproteobacteria bacterium]
MATKVCVVYHSGFGHTAKQAAAVAEGARGVSGVDVSELPVEEFAEEKSAAWELLDAAEAIIFGCPTYMGSPSAGMKKFIEATSGRWMQQQWADKLAAGFTNSGSQNGDKQNTLVDLMTFVGQHGMVWINLNILPGNNSSTGSVDDVNRLGATLGAMAQSNVDEGADVVPPESDLETARQLGARVAKCAQRWAE